MRLAPIGVVAEKLRARSPDVRTVALLHARGHGTNARGLAAHVASMLEDDEGVAWHAAGTLRLVAPGAAEAVPVLLRLLEKPGADDKLVTRALFGLQMVGKEAWAALPALEKFLGGKHGGEALAAMAAIAPNAPSVAPRIAAALFSDDYGMHRAAEDALAAGGPVDLAVTHARLLLFSFSSKKREAAQRALYTLAPLKPQAVTQLLVHLARGSKPVRPLLAAMLKLPAPLHPVLARFAVDSLDGADLELVNLALDVVEKHQLEAPLAVLLHRHAGGGASGQAAYVFGHAARLLQGAERATVDAWLEKVTTANEVSWYAVADALRASPTESNVLALARAAQRFLKSKDRSGVLDFHRSLRELTTVDVLDRAGVPVTDPYAEADAPEMDPADADYPDFPADDEPPPPGRLEEMSDAPPLLEDLGRGLSLLGRSPTATPQDLAQSLQAFLERQQGQSLDDAAVQGLAAVWAHALTTQLNWSWARWVRADERALALASPQRTHMVFPAAWVRRQLRKKEPTALLQFNLLVDGKVPPPDAEPTALW